MGVGAPSLGYGSVYSLEILLLLATLPVILPLARSAAAPLAGGETRIGLTQIPS